MLTTKDMACIPRICCRKGRMNMLVWGGFRSFPKDLPSRLLGPQQPEIRADSQSPRSYTRSEWQGSGECIAHIRGPAGERSPAGGVCKTGDPTRVSFTHWPVQTVPTLSYVFSAHPLSPFPANSTEVQNHSWQLGYGWKEEDRQGRDPSRVGTAASKPCARRGTHCSAEWAESYAITEGGTLILELVTQYDHGISITAEIPKNSLDLPHWKRPKGTQRDQWKWLWFTPDVFCMFNTLVALT